MNDTPQQLKLIEKIHAVGIGHDGEPSWFGEVLKMLPVTIVVGLLVWGFMEFRGTMYANSVQKQMNEQVARANAERDLLKEQAALLQQNADAREKELNWSIRRNGILEKSRDAALKDNAELHSLLEQRIPSELLQ